MQVDREYTKKLWGWERKEGPFQIRKELFFSDDRYHIYNSLTEKFHHYVIDTDYENYALIYGCDIYFGIVPYTYVTLLSRSDYLEYKYTRMVHETLNAINYHYVDYWVQTGAPCGFDASPTYDEIFK